MYAVRASVSAVAAWVRRRPLTEDMVDRFEIEVDTTAANEKWRVEVKENLAARTQESDEKETAKGCRT